MARIAARPTGRSAETGQDVRLLLRAASMYHLGGATHAEIAARLGVSRATAGRLVARARDRGLVRVVFDVPDHLASSVHVDLEDRLERRFGLQEVVVVDEEIDEHRPATLAALGRAAGGVLARRLHPEDTLGFTWGPETVAIADAVTGRSTRCRRLVQLDGSMTTTGYRSGVDHILDQLGDRLGAEAVRLLTPLYVDPATAAALRSDSFVSTAFRIGEAAEAMVFGCGPVSTDTTLFRGAYIDEADIEDLRAHGAVGEVAGRFFTASGDAVESALAARTLSVGLDRIRSCPLTILASGGAAKHHTILGALRGRLAKVLVTDLACAQWLAAQPPTEEGDSR